MGSVVKKEYLKLNKRGDADERTYGEQGSLLGPAVVYSEKFKELHVYYTTNYVKIKNKINLEV